MKNKRLLLGAMLLMLTAVAHAQWRVGATIGTTANHYRMDRQYMSDYHINDRWGLTMGVTGQYDFTEWLGVRADFNWTQKNHRVLRDRIPMDYKYVNNYLQLPVMASFSFGGQKLRGFCNLGVYGGYWLSSNYSGVDYNSFVGAPYDVKGHVDFNSDRDQRWDCGFVGGLGVEYRFARHWGAQVEARYYYSTTSVQKQYMRVKDYRYNSTLALQAGACYFF
jgi:opacity protein-like surface antigen